MASINGNVPIERRRLPEDPERAVDATVAKMVEIAFGEYGSRSPKVRALAHEIVRKAHVGEKDYYGEILAIHNWVKRNIRYFRDPINQETLSHPEELLFNSRGGDCDCMVVAEMALLGALGIKSFPVVIGQRPGMYSHVYLKAVVPQGRHRKAGQIIPLDPIMKDWNAGREVPHGKVASMKEYPQLEALMFNGDSDLGDIFAGLDDGRSLGAYATGPSYLQDENAQVEKLLVGDRSPKHQMTHDLVAGREARSVQNTPHVEQTKEGIDRMFGMETSVQSTVPATNVYNLGPLTSQAAQASHQPLEQGHKRKIYHGVREVMDSRRASGRRAINTIDPNRKQVSVSTNAKRKADQSAAKAPLTHRERMAELDGLGEYLHRIGRSITLVGGLGADPAEVQVTAQDIATASWWAKFKERLAAGREASLATKARHLEAARDYCGAKALRDAQKAAKAEKIAARDVAKQAKAVEQSASRDPQAARIMAETKTDLDQAEAEGQDTAAIDSRGWLGKGANEKMPASGQERAAQVARNRCERVERKIKALQARIQDARKARAKAREQMRRSPVEAPINVRSVESQRQRTRPSVQMLRSPYRHAVSKDDLSPEAKAVLSQRGKHQGTSNALFQQWAARKARGMGDLPTVPLPFLPTTLREIAEAPVVQYGTAAALGLLLMKRLR